MEIKILTFDNRVGLVTDAVLLKNLFLENNIISNIIFLDNECLVKKSDVGIWIQDFDKSLLENFKVNIFYINEEWYHNTIEDLNLFDYVICKSQYAKNTFFKNCNNVVHIPFLSKNLHNDYFKQNIEYKNLHFMGRSIQKNTECLLESKIPFTLHDQDNKYLKLPSNINHIKKYISDKNLQEMLNSHNVHICPSLYESWGHYAFEGLSTGAEIICSDIPVFREHLDPDLVHFIPTYKGVDLNYKYCKDNIDNLYPLRESYFINVDYLKQLIGEFKPKGTPHMRRMLYKSIMEKNKKLMIDFFKSI
jgi:glycosyltransferase involved in cell wall biosynthesis